MGYVGITEKSLSQISGTKSASGDNELIAAPGANKVVVVTGFLIQNTTSTATTLLLREGTTEKVGVLAQNQGDGMSVQYPMDARWKLPANTALNLNLSGANTARYSVSYYIE
jgi:hypothetical protein